MKKRIESILRGRLVLALGAAAFLGVPAAGGGDVSLVQRVDTLQNKIDTYLAQEQQPELRSDGEYVKLIEGLEYGMEALKKLGNERELKHLAAIADGLRQERKKAQHERQQGAARGGDSEIAEVRRRLGVLRFAVHGFVEAGDHAAAERVELAMRARELAIEGVRGEKLAKVREAAPAREELAGHLARAAQLWDEWGHETKARLLGELAETYAEQARRRQGREGAREREATGLDDLNARLEIVRYALAAHTEAKHPDAQEMLEWLLAIGQAQADGTPPPKISNVRGLSMGTIIELLQGASGLYREWGNGERARQCNQLAEFYARRERERAREREQAQGLEGLGHTGGDDANDDGEGRERGHDAREGEEAEHAAAVRRLTNRVEKLQAELNEVKQALRELGRERR